MFARTKLIAIIARWGLVYMLRGCLNIILLQRCFSRNPCKALFFNNSVFVSACKGWKVYTKYLGCILSILEIEIHCSIENIYCALVDKS
uniref:Putative secreted protein n=1 Tax=Panstrongylus lignarius TaxID=156445 RepID=A0A224XZ00_9HEMI